MAVHDRAIRKVFSQIAEGMSLRAACQQRGAPDKSTVLRRVADDPELRRAYEFARQIQAESLVDELLEIADDSTNDSFQTSNGRVSNPGNVGRSRLQVDTRKWILSKMLPKKYGDRPEDAISGREVKGYLVVDPANEIFSGNPGDVLEA